LPILLNNLIFNGDINNNLNDKKLKKIALYCADTYAYIASKSYKDIESSDFNFSVNRIEINYYDVINNLDNMDLYTYKSYNNLMRDFITNLKISENYNDINNNNKDIIKEKENNLEKYEKDFELNFKEINNQIKINFNQNKFRFFTNRKNKIKNCIDIIEFHGIIPYEDDSLFMDYDYSKTYMYRFHMFMKNENDIGKGLEIEKVIYIYSIIYNEISFNNLLYLFFFL
jgi:hypothetical protein